MRAGVTIETRHRFTGFGAGAGAGAGTVRFHSPAGDVERVADVVVLAMGGASWPRVGSDGGWVEVLREAGVGVAPMRPANCGLRRAWRSEFVGRYEGAPVKNVALSHGGAIVRGDIVVTAEGIEGGPVYALSAGARDAIERDGSCTITIDLQPDRTVQQVEARLARSRPGDSTSTVLRRTLGLSPVAAASVRELAGRQVPSEPPALAALVKAVPFETSSTMPIARSISSAGGVLLDEVDDRFMLRALPGVFVAGEMIDWEAPTGGYLLQASFSTGVAAARGASSWLAEREADGR
jgi:uncharacterized flavoprotein (TIGR03862 family)